MLEMYSNYEYLVLITVMIGQSASNKKSNKNVLDSQGYCVFAFEILASRSCGWTKI